MNLLADNIRSKSIPSPTTVVALGSCFDPLVKLAQVQAVAVSGEEEKCEDNSSSCSRNSSSENEPDQELDFLSTQVLVQENLTANKQPPMSPVIVQSPVKSCNSPAKVRSHSATDRSHPDKLGSSPIEMQSPIKSRLPAKPQSSKPPVAPSTIVRLEDDNTPEDFRAKGAEGMFTKVFPAVSKLVESGGWQIAQGMNTLFCAMPGVQFFNFKPNINVFDSKIKACWKFIEIAGKKTGENEDQELWELLWPIAQKEFKWFTMACGSEIWYVKPETKFEHFVPNETVFQCKKRAVLKCLAGEVGEIELGESAEGHQVVSFAVQSKAAPAGKKAKTSLFKTPSPAITSVKRSTPTSISSAQFVTPAKQASAASTTSNAKRKLSSSASKGTKTTSATKKEKAGKTGIKKPTTKKVVSDTAADVNKADEFNFVAPIFRCSFGILYAKLQDEGWYHKSGVFEYDYFSPTYTDATKELNVNYFRSQADLEDFLKVSGTWKRVEDDLRQEHELVVEEERGKALERHDQRLEQQATRKRNLARYGQPAVQKTKKGKKSYRKASNTSPSGQSLYQAEVEAAQATGVEENLSKLPKLKFGTVLKKLIARGWYYRPGRFEYDYFKPSANPKTAVSGEDRFESASALEIYLKTTGLWEQIAEEVAHDKDDALLKRPGKRNKLESPHLTVSPSPKESANGAVEKEDLEAITNDIWANSHEFEFDE